MILWLLSNPCILFSRKLSRNIKPELGTLLIKTLLITTSRKLKGQRTLGPLFTKRTEVNVLIGTVTVANQVLTKIGNIFAEHSLLIVLLDLFMAGADTTSATLYWAFLFMVRNEEVQRKVQNEIDSVLGNASPSLEHRKLWVLLPAK